MPDHELREALSAVLWSDMQPPPSAGGLPLLAHYTSIATLERIAETGELWFSNPLYMNDVDELRYGMTLGLEAVRTHAGLRHACPPDHYNELLDAFGQLYTAFDDESAFDVYVFSCSEHGPGIGDDGLLSMWRGYGSDGNGIAIVFDFNELVARTQPAALLLRQVQYHSYEESRAWMDGKLANFARALAALRVPLEEMAATAEELFERIKLFALFTKHRGFHEEREWRMVYLRERDREGVLAQQLNYAIGPRGIEPRLRFAVPALGTDAPPLDALVERVILGPVLATPLSLRSTRRMLEIHRPAWATRVVRSTTPYRMQRRGSH
ncbi:MAG TPA: DUF2971 domain-containing protein [Ramlibacter sp.]|uniref:DUF2971 domain-containing protein n=1 Tax=Ramlibacter sp. TaxID=1917967 RepID=UPI002BA647C5|nr:DUF2971 domain-containing protein [Ramlibacter sp.]HVZ45996.1 DUF2971 domain-containing protein [Ramlibacter sp.]